VPADCPIPVIDLFAGPGGLGKGFASLRRPDGQPALKIGLAKTAGMAADFLRRSFLPTAQWAAILVRAAGSA